MPNCNLYQHIVCDERKRSGRQDRGERTSGSCVSITSRRFRTWAFSSSFAKSAIRSLYGAICACEHGTGGGVCRGEGPQRGPASLPPPHAAPWSAGRRSPRSPLRTTPSTACLPAARAMRPGPRPQHPPPSMHWKARCPHGLAPRSQRGGCPRTAPRLGTASAKAALLLHQQVGLVARPSARREAAPCPRGACR